MRYIKNNKRRVAVPIVSLCLCFVLTYITGFLLSTTEVTFSSIYLDNAEKIQYVDLSDKTLGTFDSSLESSSAALGTDITQRLEKRNSVTKALADKLTTHSSIKKAYTANLLGISISPAIGRANYLIPLVEKNEVSSVLSDFGAALAEGRLPENPGELVLDMASIKNTGSELGSYYDYDTFKDRYKIVGVLDCDQYFGCGIPSKEDAPIKSIVLFSDIRDITSELKAENITVTDNDLVYDYNYGKDLIDKEITEAISSSTKYIYGGILLILMILLTVVYTMYLRERHNEWCLYCSIGFSRTSIYLSIMRELLFTFITALAAGAVLIGASLLLLNMLMIEPNGLKCQFFDLASLGKVLCAYVFLIGILQIPISYALVKVRTVDAIEDDLY